MAEKITLTVPDVQVPAAPDYQVAQITINSGVDYVAGSAIRGVEFARISVVLVSSNGVPRQLTLYAGAEAVTAIHQLNTANLSTKSLERRLLERVIALDGRFAGTISGSPD